MGLSAGLVGAGRSDRAGSTGQQFAQQSGSLPMFKGRVAVAVSILGALLFGASMINVLVGPSYDLEMYPVKLVDRMVAADVIGGDIRPHP